MKLTVIHAKGNLFFLASYGSEIPPSVASEFCLQVKSAADQLSAPWAVFCGTEIVVYGPDAKRSDLLPAKQALEQLLANIKSA